MMEEEYFLCFHIELATSVDGEGQTLPFGTCARGGREPVPGAWQELRGGVVC